MMAICGYNDAIGSGVRTLCAGMYTSLKEKASASGQPIDVVLDIEIRELKCLMEQLAAGIGAHGSARMLYGLNLLALELFQLIRADLQSGVQRWNEASTRHAENFINFLETTESLHRAIRNDTTNAKLSPEDIMLRLAARLPSDP